MQNGHKMAELPCGCHQTSHWKWSRPQFNLFLQQQQQNIHNYYILLLETPCSSVGPLVGHVFYPHLTRTHTNLMCERRLEDDNDNNNEEEEEEDNDNNDDKEE